jgi:hypothetical protein
VHRAGDAPLVQVREEESLKLARAPQIGGLVETANMSKRCWPGSVAVPASS